jgi:hypothetical protein
MKDTTEETSHDTEPVTPAPYGSPNYIPTPSPATLAAFRVAPPKADYTHLMMAVAHLGAACSLILKSERWVRQHLAVAEGDFECSPFGSKAKAWSMTGAMLRMVKVCDDNPDLSKHIAWAALSTSIRDRHNNASIGYFNDFIATSVEDVVAEFTAAADLIDSIRKERGL